MNRAAPLTEDPADPVLLRTGASVEVEVAGVPQAPPAQVEDLRPGRPPARAKRARGYRLRGRHARARGRLRMPVSLSAVAQVELAEDRLVLQVLRAHAVADLDSAQVTALSALPPSVAVPCLDRLVRLGLVRRHVVGGRERFGLL